MDESITISIMIYNYTISTRIIVNFFRTKDGLAIYENRIDHHSHELYSALRNG